MHLGNHFELEDFARSDTARQSGIQNKIPEASIQGGLYLVETVLNPFISACGTVTLTSGYRSRELNSILPGSSRNSQHIWTPWSAAVDFVPNEVDLRTAFLWMVGHLRFDQLIWEKGRWIHVSASRRRARQDIRYHYGGRSYPKWTHSSQLIKV